MAQLTDLPVELLILIFSFLEDTPREPSQSICMMVCRQWYEIILDMASLPGTQRLPMLFASLPGTKLLPLFAEVKPEFKSFIDYLYKSVSLLEWSQILELPEKFPCALTEPPAWGSDEHNYFSLASYVAAKKRNIDVLMPFILKGFRFHGNADDCVISRNDIDMLHFLIIYFRQKGKGDVLKHKICEARLHPHILNYLLESRVLSLLSQ